VGVDLVSVSYAAAWEIGRLLTLQKTRVAIDLFICASGNREV
jgi:hypothetical protein